MFLRNNYTQDSRIIKETETLSNEFDIEVICQQDKKDDEKIIKKNKLIIRRVVPYYSDNRIILKFQNYILFPAISAIHGALTKADIYQANDADTLIQAYISAKLNRGKILYDSHEIFSELEMNKNNIFLGSIFNLIESVIIPNTDARITTNEHRAKFLEEKFGKKFQIMENYSTQKYAPKDYDMIKKRIRKEYGVLSSDTLFIYCGRIHNRRIEETLRAFEKVKNKNIRFLIAGNTQKYKLRVSDDRVALLGRVDAKKVTELEIASDVGFIFYEPTNLNNIYASSNKIFSYMTNGCAIITSNDILTNRETVENEKTGLCVNPANEKEIQKAIQWMIDNPKEVEIMKKRGMKAAKDKYNWEANESRFINIYLDLMKK